VVAKERGYSGIVELIKRVADQAVHGKPKSLRSNVHSMRACALAGTK
jgi:hypothetical protein